MTKNPTQADLIFSTQANHNFSHTLGELKRSNLSIRNRLESIEHDAAFVRRVARAYGREEALVKNERCGGWYVAPRMESEEGEDEGVGDRKAERSAYFKSTDGHTGVWKFSSRRLNLHLLGLVGREDGCIIVDSTRRGKRMPDALSKTIPIWCAVLNRFIFPALTTHHVLYTPPNVVSASEHAQISALLPGFVAALEKLRLDRDELRERIQKPLRPIWVTPDSMSDLEIEELIEEVSRLSSDHDSNLYTDSDEAANTKGKATQSGASPKPSGLHRPQPRKREIFKTYHPIICLTASRRIVGTEMSEGGYIQGAGDDTENWAHGLTPSIFWSNRDLLMATHEQDLVEVIERLVSEAGAGFGKGMRFVKPCRELWVGGVGDLNVSRGEVRGKGEIMIVLSGKVTPGDTWLTAKTRMDVGVGHSKLGSRNLRTALPSITSFLASHLSPSSLPPSQIRILLACDTGTDLSIGVALAVLCLFCDDEGALKPVDAEELSEPGRRIDKDFIRSRMSWISTSLPDANPSRATLQSVNAFLMRRD